MGDRVRVLSGGQGGPSPRGGLTVVALVVGLVLVAAAFVIGRLTAPGSSPRSSRPPAAPAAGIPGPSRVVDGVGVGYPHTQAGAVAALLADGQTLGDPRVLLNPSRRTQVLTLIATARYAAQFSGSGGQALAQAERQTALGRGLESGAQTVYLAVPVAYRVTSYTPERITVVGYGVSVAANDQGLSPRATWAMSTTTAVWQDSDWKVDSASSSDGPTPALTDRPSSASALLGALAGAREVHDAP
jgi:hypothetical protein